MRRRTVVFLSNYFNHHQYQLSQKMSDNYIGNYWFVETSEMTTERQNMGWILEDKPEYVISEDDCLEYVNNVDVVILGSAPFSLLQNRCDKLNFIYSERIFKSKIKLWKYPFVLYRFNRKYYKLKNTYLLAASAFAKKDFEKINRFRNRSYKWGYFPETKIYTVSEIVKQKQANKILWCGRFIDLKHPEDMLQVAKKLKDNGYNFVLEYIGSGLLEKKLKNIVMEYNLVDNVKFLGTMKPEQVRKYMEQSGIYVFTSDRHEGWGAVLNESMNSMCAVVASHAIGSVPFLIENNKNGLVYESGNVEMLYKKVKYLLDNPEEQVRLGKAAYQTIVEEWNAEVAVERFAKLVEHILSGEEAPDLYERGPCSKAEIIKDNWFREKC